MNSMIKLLESTLPSLPCAGSFVGIKITANYLSYGNKFAFCAFWVQFENDTPTALICKFEETILISAMKNADVNELKQFCYTLGFKTMHADLDLLKKMNLNNITEYQVLFLKGNGTAFSNSFTMPSLEKVYDIIYSEYNINIFKNRWEGWYADLSHRIRHGTAAAVCNENAACIASHITNDSAIISGIAVLPEKRRMHLGSKIINEMLLILKGRNIFAAAEPAVVPFYEKHDFVPVGTVGIYIAKEEQYA